MTSRRRPGQSPQPNESQVDPQPVDNVVEGDAVEGEQPVPLSDDESGPEPLQVRETRTESAKRDTKGFVEPRPQPPWETAAKLGGIVYPGRPSPPTGTVVFEGREYPIVRNCSWTEEQYVAHELAITKAEMDRGLKDIVVDGVGRMERSEKYLRWRYRGFLAGQIAAL